MAAAEKLPTTVEEQRLAVLLELGFSLRQAGALLYVPDIGHAAAELIAEGCSPRLAYRILKPL
jgi:hypothetical protein